MHVAPLHDDPPATVFVQDFTGLRFPERLPDGCVLHHSNTGSLSDIPPFSILAVRPAHIRSAREMGILRTQSAILLWDPDHELGTLPGWVDIRLSDSPDEKELLRACEQARKILQLKEENIGLQTQVTISETRYHQVNQIGVALMSEKDLGKLLTLILEKAMDITSSDAGCLYLVEPDPSVPEDSRDYWINKRMRFKLTRNRSVKFGFAETVIPINRTSISGHALLCGEPISIEDVYHIPENAPYRHGRAFDEASGYRTKSMLTVPMKNNEGRVTGALQLINKCRYYLKPITSEAAAAEQVTAFNQEDLNVSLSLTSQASIAIANAQYQLDIQNLFEGFIKASVTAIESRDPTTSGHSNRVADYCVRLAECLNTSKTGPHSNLDFTTQQLRELRYAALLHDFGKIGVREHILTKPRKLFQEEMERIFQRFEQVKGSIRMEILREKLRLYQQNLSMDPAMALASLDGEEMRRLAEIDEFFRIVMTANEPSPLHQDVREILMRVAQATFRDTQGREMEFLTPDELERLSIGKGSLSTRERLEIESHVSHTFRFLSKIPWTGDLRGVPDIAHAHHEKLDGSGYPRALKSDEIPVQSRIMTICDIYDALTASDRPYKKAMPPERALDILGMEVKEGKLDEDLYRIFLEGRVYQLQF